LKESERRFRVMADSAPTLIWMADADGEITYLNQRTLDFTGETPEALRNGGWQSLVHPDDLSRVLHANSTYLRVKAGFSKEFRLRRHDGAYRWMFDISAPRFGEDGSFLGFIGSVIDVTDQKSATEALEKLGGRLIEAQEKERSLIARELHDDICQRLAMLAVKIERTMDNQDMASGLRHQAMKDAWKQCSNLAGDVQALSHELHSSILDHLGLAAAADNFCQEFAKLHEVRVEFVQQNVPDSLPRDVPLSLFRVLQEALRNALKHSSVNRFYVCLRGTPAKVTLEIWDQGVGFDLQKAKANGGIGLISVEERVNLLGGSLMIESGVGLGTKIRVSIPLVESGATAEKRVAASQG
jgi:PAS domain S-box-containing protein